MSGRQYEYLRKAVEKLLKKDKFNLFASPVEPTETFLPDYFDVVKHPMDLGSVVKKMNNREYKTAEEVISDIKLTFSNAVLYNGTEGESGFVGIEAIKLQEAFDEMLAKMPKDDDGGMAVELPELESEKALKKKPTKRVVETDEDQKKKKARKEPLRPFTFEEKGQLGARIGHLPSDRLPHIVEIIQNGPSASKLKEGRDEKAIDVDLSDIDLDTLYKIKEYVDSVSADAITHTSDDVEGLDPTPLQWRDKTALCSAINSLSEDNLLQVFHIVRQNAPKLCDNVNAAESYVEVDLNKLDTITLRKIQRFISSTASAQQTAPMSM